MVRARPSFFFPPAPCPSLSSILPLPPECIRLGRRRRRRPHRQPGLWRVERRRRQRRGSQSRRQVPLCDRLPGGIGVQYLSPLSSPSKTNEVANYSHAEGAWLGLHTSPLLQRGPGDGAGRRRLVRLPVGQDAVAQARGRQSGEEEVRRGIQCAAIFLLPPVPTPHFCPSSYATTATRRTRS